MNTQALAELALKKIETLPETDRLFQEKHLGFFKEQGFKVTDPDFYKFTNLETFFGSLQTNLPSSGSFDKSQYQDFPTLIFMDGKLESENLGIKGISVKKLGADFPQEFIPHPRINAATHLHHSLLSDGVMLTVDKGTEVKTPIRIIYVATHAEVAAPSIFVNAGSQSQLTLMEEHISLLPGAAHLTESYFLVDKGAQVEHIQIGDGQESLQHASTYAHVHQDGQFRSCIFHLGGKLNRRNLDLKLAAPGANGESYNLYLTQAKEHSDISTVIEHLSADTTSNQLAKGILDGESKGIFTGKIHIHPQAQRVASGQLNKNLLLSKKAQAHSQPQLEIFADDVKCSHGSTTGQLSPEELFYFQARGIPADKARTLLARGFAMEVVNKINNKEASVYVSKLIGAKLDQKFKI